MGDARRKQISQQLEQTQMRRLPEGTTPGQVVPPGMKVIAFLSPQIDCCVEKIIGEMAPYWHRRGYFPIVVNEKKPRECLNYMPSKLILFRSATKPMMVQEVNELASFTKYISNLGCRTFYYIDDMLLSMNKGAPMFLASNCDEIIVATEKLRQIMTNHLGHKPIHLLKTHIDLPTIDASPKSSLIPFEGYNILATSQGRIGALMIYHIMEKMNETPEKYKNVNMIFIANQVSQIRSIINKFRNVKKIYKEFMPLKDFYSAVKSVDLILSPGEVGDLDYMIPRTQQQDWLDSKSCVKYTLAGAVGLPSISTKYMAEYANSVKHGETGFLAGEVEEWIQYIDLCISDRELTSKIGTAARKDMEENYDVKIRANEFIDVFEGKKFQSTAKHRIWLPPISGGPRSFYNTMKKYIPKMDKEWEITEALSTNVDAAIVVAFLGIEDALKKRAINPKIKIISRVDGLPMVMGTDDVNRDQVDIMVKIMKEAKLVVYQSEFSRRVWEPFTKDVKTPYVIIPNGVDQEIFNPNGEKFPLDQTRMNVLNVNFSTFKHKRHDLLEQLIQGHPEVHFTLVGHYQDTTVLIDMEKWSVYDNVTYLGPILDYSDDGRKRLASLYRAADVLLFPSEMEGSPNTILEAASCGLPVVYNDAIDIVPELLGAACIAIKDFDWKKSNWNHFLLEGVAKKYSGEAMAKAYLEVCK